MNTKLRLTVVAPSGILDKIRGNQLHCDISDLINNGTNIILIDMKDIKFIDSSGLGLLMSIMQMASKANVKFFICSINEQVRMLFELTKVNKFLQVFIDQDDCKRYILTNLYRVTQQ
ncbi:putative anti-sigma factor antagonist [Nostoc sp. HK-01]|uniref:Anti-sigma factor antagonist n=1 Tax=Anabaenopsis circularis NIES-21 TaxID=1085406 RepID=A0A1Z4GMT0_9CYAN|nr:putative anti-sigma factor antagonist [Anabaenopsis circularis NIES-21]BBD62557.1 putative anti-sigma factor antagonist [Nostoc sp. HK-01]